MQHGRSPLLEGEGRHVHVLPNSRPHATTGVSLNNNQHTYHILTKLSLSLNSIQHNSLSKKNSIQHTATRLSPCLTQLACHCCHACLLISSLSEHPVSPLPQYFLLLRCMHVSWSRGAVSSTSTASATPAAKKKKMQQQARKKMPFQLPCVCTLLLVW
jgi:hypothetical protein